MLLCVKEPPIWRAAPSGGFYCMKTFAFIDAANLFYGGVKSLGWRIDYQKLLVYLQGKYSAEKIFYFAGVDGNESRLRFYKKLENFGYQLCLKPVKEYIETDGWIRRKANCDVELTFYLMKQIHNYQRVILLSGDADFLMVLEHLHSIGKEVIILARRERTAKELRMFAKGSFCDFTRLENQLRFREKNREDVRNIPSAV